MKLAASRNSLETGDTTGNGEDQSRPRPFRLVPPAITPLDSTDLATGFVDHLRGVGRDEFRATIEDYLGARMSATYTSYRRALGGCFLELADADRRERTDVIVPAFRSYDFDHAIEGVGLNCVEYDVDPETFAPDLESVHQLPLEDALALVVVNVLGYGAPIDDLAARCEAHDVYLVEALGYSFGSTYEGRRLGTFGDCAVLNFQQGKPIPTGGGMVVSHRPELNFTDEGRRAVRPNVGVLAGYTLFSHPRPYYVYSRVAERFGDVVAERTTTHPESKQEVGYSRPFGTMSNFQGTVAHRVFDRLDDTRRRRAITARQYEDALKDCSGVELLRSIPGHSDHQFVRYPILIEPSIRRTLKETLYDRGIHATTLYDWPPIDADHFPGAARVQERILTLPTHPYVDEDDRQLIVDTVREVTTCQTTDSH